MSKNCPATCTIPWVSECVGRGAVAAGGGLGAVHEPEEGLAPDQMPVAQRGGVQANHTRRRPTSGAEVENPLIDPSFSHS